MITDKETLVEIINAGVCYKRRTSLSRSHQKFEHWALLDISLKIKKGDVIGIIGKNGAGKSTMMALLAQSISPTKVKSTSQMITMPLFYH